ncbi:MAG: hypothetical protein A2138_14920 [Deltaproteobacteria bacterium RBG_16_71_12]|nr:MAG: hypothetical protein A2138_14920 [Deltaproteobacteria bacterium RBG_16_71_12]
MPVALLRRTLEPALARAAKERPAVLLTGPRQSGKTTLLRRMFGRTHRYVSLDDLRARALALEDPTLFLAEHPPPVVVDEIQYAPTLLSAIKLDVDAHRGATGRWLLTGSQQFPLMAGVTESLAGRIAVVQLLPMSLGEQLRMPMAAPFAAGPARGRAAAVLDARALARRLVRGGWPELVAKPRLDADGWQASYLQTYLERDVRALRQVGDLHAFQTFLRALAARNAQITNYSDIARDLGVVVNTVRAWIAVLEASQQIFVLRPWFRNLGRRLVKSPKIYFLETGLLCHLLGLLDARTALAGPAAGALFETFVLGEIVRAFTNVAAVPRVSFYRTAAGEEVDFVVEHGGRLHPIEVKLTATPTPRHASAVDAFAAAVGSEAAPGRVVCLVPSSVALTRTCRAIPAGAFALGRST